MKEQAFQPGEIRDENDNIIREGAYGKHTAFVTGDNVGILDYIMNNFDVLMMAYKTLTPYISNVKTIHVNENGQLVVTTTDGTEHVIDVAQGAPGKDGTNGQDGKAATIQIGTVTTGEAGSRVAVTNTGTASDAVLNFSIPQGQAGIQGPRGEPGETGAPGEAGKAATIQVGHVITEGNTVKVVNSGTENAAVFDFTFPQSAEDAEMGQDDIDDAWNMAKDN